MRFLFRFEQVEYLFSFTGASNPRFDGMVKISMTLSKIALRQWAIAFDSKKLKVPRLQMLYTTHVEKVILVSTIPSNIALDAPVNEVKKKFNLHKTEQKSYSDNGLQPWILFTGGLNKHEHNTLLLSQPSNLKKKNN